VFSTEYAFFAQDHWALSSRVAVDLGTRVESQEVTASFRLAPRLGVAWSPSKRTGTVFRFGSGLFYDHVPLNVYAFNLYPRLWQAFFGPDGNITAGPYYYGNALSQVNLRTPFVFRNQGPGRHSHFSMSMIPCVNTIPSFLRRRSCSSPLFPGREIFPFALMTLCQGIPVPPGRL